MWVILVQSSTEIIHLQLHYYSSTLILVYILYMNFTSQNEGDVYLFFVRGIVADTLVTIISFV